MRTGGNPAIPLHPATFVLLPLAPPGVERRPRRNPAGPARVNVYLFIIHSFIVQLPRVGQEREGAPCSPVCVPALDIAVRAEPRGVDWLESSPRHEHCHRPR
jgi:hypothetical protein